jgi:hypothetical protein
MTHGGMLLSYKHVSTILYVRAVFSYEKILLYVDLI